MAGRRLHGRLVKDVDGKPVPIGGAKGYWLQLDGKPHVGTVEADHREGEGYYDVPDGVRSKTGRLIWILPDDEGAIITPVIDMTKDPDRQAVVIGADGHTIRLGWKTEDPTPEPGQPSEIPGHTIGPITKPLVWNRGTTLAGDRVDKFGGLFGLENLALFSIRQRDTAAEIRKAAALGARSVRAMVTLSRSPWGHDKNTRQPALPNWFIGPWDGKNKVNKTWQRDYLLPALEACREYGVYLILCMTDEPSRTTRSKTDPITGKPGEFPASLGPWMGETPSMDMFKRICGVVLDGLSHEANPELIIEMQNEQNDPDNPDSREEWWNPNLTSAKPSEWLGQQGWEIRMNDVRDFDRTSGIAQIGSEHQYPRYNGRIPKDELEAIQGRRRIAHYTTDGGAIYRWDLMERVRYLTPRGISQNYLMVNPFTDLAPWETKPYVQAATEYYKLIA